MQIRGVSELQNLDIKYKDALHMPALLDKAGVYIETSYNTGTANNPVYDSKKIDLCALVQCLYTSINNLCAEITTLRTKVNNDNNALSSSSTKQIQGIYGYNYLINSLNNTVSNNISAISAQLSSKIDNVSAELSNYLNINTDIAQEVIGEVSFLSTIQGNITNAVLAEHAQWN